MFEKVSWWRAVAALIAVSFMLSISWKFSYDLGHVNASMYYDRGIIEQKIKDKHEILPFDLLRAAQRSADYSLAQVYLAYLALIVSGLALIGLTVSLRQTHETINNARTMAEAEATCYLHASKVSWSKRGRLVLNCHNTGNTPATQFSISCHAYVETRGQVSANLNLEPARLKTWSALAAHSEYTVSLDEVDFREVDQFLQCQNDPMLVFVVTGNIYYKNVFGKTFNTQFAFYTSSGNTDAKFVRPTSRLEVHSPVKEAPIDMG